MKVLQTAAAAAAIAALVFSAGAAPAAPRMRGRRVTATAVDRLFVHDASEGNRAEVALGRLALQDAVSASVRDFAERMTHDHAMANKRLARAIRGSREGLRMARRLSPKDIALSRRLSRLSGAAFDHAYIRSMVEGHRATATEFRNATIYVGNPRLRRWAAQTLPTVEMHLRMARRIAQRITHRTGA